jgi:hypothetical protein
MGMAAPWGGINMSWLDCEAPLCSQHPHARFGPRMYYVGWDYLVQSLRSRSDTPIEHDALSSDHRLEAIDELDRTMDMHAELLCCFLAHTSENCKVYRARTNRISSI